MSEWIKCSDRLPEVNSNGFVRVIAFCELNLFVGEMEYLYPQYATTARGKKPRWQWGGRISHWEVTHWMPLPPPPEDKS